MANLQKYCLFWSIGLFLWGGQLSLFSQAPKEAPATISPIFSIDKVLHQADPTLLAIPFSYSSLKETEVFTFSWSPNCEYQDTLYMEVRGAAWIADLYLNGKFLSSLKKPLANWRIPIAGEWIQPLENTFTLHIHSRGYFPNYPHTFISLQYPIQIFEQAPSSLPLLSPYSSQKGDSVWVWAPYFREKGPIFDEAIALQNLAHILQSKVRTVYFPFPPPEELLELVENAGLVCIDSLIPPLHLAMLNSFPYEEISFTLPRSFWLDLEGRRTSFYGQFDSWVRPVIYQDPLDPGLGIISILLFPLIALLVVKFSNPSFYFSILRIFTQPDKYIDSLQEASPGNSGFSFIVLFINLISVSVLVFLFVYLIHRTQAWGYVQFFRENNLLTQVFYPTQYVSSLFIRSLLVVSLGFLLKYLLLGLLGSVFSIRNMTSGSINLDIITNFPYVQFLSIPLILVLINPVSTYMYGILFILLGIIFFLRKMYTYFYGLERLFDFSLGVKILYICAFNILPYIIWF